MGNRHSEEKKKVQVSEKPKEILVPTTGDLKRDWKEGIKRGFGLTDEGVPEGPFPSHFEGYYKAPEDGVRLSGATLLTEGGGPLAVAPWRMYPLMGLDFFDQHLVRAGSLWPQQDYFWMAYQGHGIVSYGIGLVCFYGRTAVYAFFRYGPSYDTGKFAPLSAFGPLFKSFADVAHKLKEIHDLQLLDDPHYFVVALNPNDYSLDILGYMALLEATPIVPSLEKEQSQQQQEEEEEKEKGKATSTSKTRDKDCHWKMRPYVTNEVSQLFAVQTKDDLYTLLKSS